MHFLYISLIALHLAAVFALPAGPQRGRYSSETQLFRSSGSDGTRWKERRLARSLDLSSAPFNRPKRSEWSVAKNKFVNYLMLREVSFFSSLSPGDLALAGTSINIRKTDSAVGTRWRPKSQRRGEAHHRGEICADVRPRSTICAPAPLRRRGRLRRHGDASAALERTPADSPRHLTSSQVGA